MLLRDIYLGSEATPSNTNIPMNILVHKDGLWAWWMPLQINIFWIQDIIEVFYHLISKP